MLTNLGLEYYNTAHYSLALDAPDVVSGRSRREGLQQPVCQLSRVERAAQERGEMRISHLEQVVEGLQDSVHRQTTRQAKLIAELQAQVDPGAMGAALSKDARERGL